jgi:hypothetical protein
MAKTIGEELSPILTSIESTLWEYEAYEALQPHFTIDGFRASMKIFMATMMDKMYDFQVKKGMCMKDKESMATELGEKVRAMVKEYTGIDTIELYKSYEI